SMSSFASPGSSALATISPFSSYRSRSTAGSEISAVLEGHQRIGQRRSKKSSNIVPSPVPSGPSREMVATELQHWSLSLYFFHLCNTFFLLQNVCWHSNRGK